MNKSILLLILFLNISIFGSAQSKPDTMPVYPGCEQTSQKMSCLKKQLLQHISNNFNDALLHAVKDTDQVNMMVSFTINFDGSIGNINIQSPYQSLNKEMERIINLVPKMVPAKTHGDPISIQYQLPLSFEIKN